MSNVNVYDLLGEQIDDEMSKTIIDVCMLVSFIEKDKRKIEVNVYNVSDDEIQEMNKKHRNVDRATDVLSFPIGVQNPETGAYILGEIMISNETTAAQAVSLQHSFERETAFLCIHGMLHLYGYDHKEKTDEDIMIKKQQELIEIVQNEILDQEDIIKRNIPKARSLLKNAYAPYSNFHVASVVITVDNSTFVGVNIENASFGATSCAERNAIFSAVSKGKKDIKIIIIASGQKDYIYPCGICRQVMSEFLKPWSKVVVTADDNSYKIYRPYELLPNSFTEF